MISHKELIGNKLIHSLIYFFVRIFVRPKLVSEHSIQSIQNRNDLVICYIIPFRSIVDKIILQIVCKRLNLATPNQKITLQNKSYVNTLALSRSLYLPLKVAQYNELSDQFDDYKKIENADKVQFVPVNIMFGRAPYRQSKKRKTNSFYAALNKIRNVIFSGRRCFILFSKPITLSQITQLQTQKKASDVVLYRAIKLLFFKQFFAFIGPVILKRKIFLNYLLEQPILKNMVQEEAKLTNKSQDIVRNEALKLLKEISADYRYSYLKITDIVLTFAWHKLYQGLNVKHSDAIRKLAVEGQEIIFAPCHRSHMDYMLLSYVLYQEALVPPHIAAGVNLNFWPAGPIFRRLGAFFIRRTFRGNKLYTVIFREYLTEIFKRGYSVEYFMEGGRSRSGRLLEPKTGLLLMTVQTLLRDKVKPITIVPVYIGYEHVMEVKTYSQELKGAEKKRENMWQMINGLRKLKNLGFGYVNFGEPIPLHSFLNQSAPDWKMDRDKTESARPTWLTPTVNLLANKVMENINKAAALNALNLLSLILISAENQLPKSILLEQLTLHIELIKKVPYSLEMTYPTESATELFDHVNKMDKLIIQNNSIIGLDLPQNESYYRNNIQHIFIIPSLITLLLKTQKEMTTSGLIEQISLIYPFLKAEFFLYFNETELFDYVENYLEYLTKEHDLKLNQGIVEIEVDALNLVSNHVVQSLKRYQKVLSILDNAPEIAKGALEKQWREESIKEAAAMPISTLDQLDKTLYAQITPVLKDEAYFTEQSKRERLISLLKTILIDSNLIKNEK